MFGGAPYSSMAPASKKALEREATAKTRFLQVVDTFHQQSQQQHDFLPGATHTFSSFLTPDIHLTSHTYGTFHRWVKSNHPNWRCKRRQATAEECKEHGAYNSGKSYFVDAIYEHPDPEKKKRLAKNAEYRAAKKAKLEAQRDPSTIFPKLGRELQIAVLSFIEDDVPRLQALLATPFKEIVERDELWEDRLRSLLKDKFDEAFEKVRGDPTTAIVPISKRPNWRQSTEFRAWYNECMAVQEPIQILDSVHADTIIKANEFIQNAGDNDDPVPEKFKWLLQDVSLCEYYLQAKAYADVGEEEMRIQFCDDTNRCYGCFQKWHSCACR